MKSETKIFWSYIFNLKGFLNSVYDIIQDLLMPKKLFFFLLILAFASLFLLKNRLLSIIFILLTIIIYLRIIYKTGDYMRWYRDKKGIPSSSEIKKLKDAQRKKKNKENPSSTYLETQNLIGEENLDGDMPSQMDTHSSENLI